MKAYYTLMLWFQTSMNVMALQTCVMSTLPAPTPQAAIHVTATLDSLLTTQAVQVGIVTLIKIDLTYELCYEY